VVKELKNQFLNDLTLNVTLVSYINKEFEIRALKVENHSRFLYNGATKEL
jgi:hypothetical protein